MESNKLKYNFLKVKKLPFSLGKYMQEKKQKQKNVWDQVWRRAKCWGGNYRRMKSVESFWFLEKNYCSPLWQVYRANTLTKQGIFF